METTNSNRIRKTVVSFSKGVREDYDERPFIGPLFDWSEDAGIDTQDADIQTIAELSPQCVQVRAHHGYKPCDYKMWIAPEAKQIGGMVGKKRGIAQTTSLVNYFDGSSSGIPEELRQCAWESQQPLLDKSEAVWEDEGPRSIKEASVSVPIELQGFDKLIKLWDVHEWRILS